MLTFVHYYWKERLMGKEKRRQVEGEGGRERRERKVIDHYL
jgi:hypothetical protein